MIHGRFNKRLVIRAVAFALLFTLVAAAQIIYLDWHTRAILGRQFPAWANLVAAEIHVDHQWDTTSYRQASINVPAYYVIANSGLLVDIEGYVPGLITHVAAPQLTLETPATVTTEIGETWRLLAHKVTGGTVFLGVPHPAEYKDVDDILSAATRLFGTTLESALNTKNSAINRLVHSAIVDDDSMLRFSLGGIPLRMDSQPPESLSQSHAFRSSTGNSYSLYSQSLLDVSNRQIGTVIIPQKLDTSFLGDAIHFNIIVGAIAWLAALILTAIYLIPAGAVEETMPIADAIREGEGPRREFKETLEFDPSTGQALPALVLACLKTIAAFLNAEGGTLYIGVADNGEIKGIERDFTLCNKRSQNRDGFALKLQALVSDRIEPKPLGRVRIGFHGNEGDPTVCKVSVQPSPVVVHVDKKQIYVRDGNATRLLDGSALTHWILQRTKKHRG